MCTSILNNVLQETSGITPLNMTAMLFFFVCYQCHPNIFFTGRNYKVKDGTIKDGCHEWFNNVKTNGFSFNE